MRKGVAYESCWGAHGANREAIVGSLLSLGGGLLGVLYILRMMGKLL